MSRANIKYINEIPYVPAVIKNSSFLGYGLVQKPKTLVQKKIFSLFSGITKTKEKYKEKKLDTALVIMAAGIGSRYGNGTKQLEQIGPNGEYLMEYAIQDAIAARFTKVVFIIRKDLEDVFRKELGEKYSDKIKVEYAIQDLRNVPEYFEFPKGRTKPWGTGHAILSAADVLNEPFCTINADDYYGPEAFSLMQKALTNPQVPISIVAYRIGNTLSENGGVTRALIGEENGFLMGMKETRNIIRTPKGPGVMTPEGMDYIDPESYVSMNLFGFQPDFVEALKEGFHDFLYNTQDVLTDEFLLPDIVNRLVKGGCKVRVLHSNDEWFGLTYQEDKELARRKARELCLKTQNWN